MTSLRVSDAARALSGTSTARKRTWEVRVRLANGNVKEVRVTNGKIRLQRRPVPGWVMPSYVRKPPSPNPSLKPADWARAIGGELEVAEEQSSEEEV
jgi:hypothetical protein